MRRESVDVNGDKVSVGQEVDLEIQSMTLEGQSIARLNGYVLFVSGAIPGEVVRAKITSVGSKFGRARVLSVADPAKTRVTPKCRHFGRCGGCLWQHMDYQEQLRWKEELLRATLAHKLPGVGLPILPMIGVPEPWGTRNKIHYSVVDFGHGRTANPHLCHHKEHSTELEQIHECPVHHPAGDEIARLALKVLRDRGVPCARPDSAATGLKSILVRTAGSGEQSHVVLVVTGERIPEIQGVEQALLALPGVVGVHLNLQPDAASTYIGRETRSLAGEQRLIEHVGGVDFHVSPDAFFQTNTYCADQLLKLVQKHLPNKSMNPILDLYSGVGLFSIPLAVAGHRVTAVEENPKAVSDGVETIRRNGVTGCRFVQSRAQNFMKTQARDQRFKTVILDPPRDGCPEWTIRLLGRGLRPRQIINVSCNPQALATDLSLLTQSGYRISEIQPVDMFPHTAHIETVVLLERIEETRGRRPGKANANSRP
ncbi:MAG: 23S rRNA (uracil(1939)-C(5))-methyltransferase RlmD [Planctomycetota bacterium]|nr:23S rRNA (uracil(1939)-C(5))-methyltransferase RlmD [Planctomycetota bacterium]MDA1162822.1 23S rRNA (uracil(1939)-C(5))-methyltransferase RlmD [Planctomycetota bacterium]